MLRGWRDDEDQQNAVRMASEAGRKPGKCDVQDAKRRKYFKG